MTDVFKIWNVCQRRLIGDPLIELLNVRFYFFQVLLLLSFIFREIFFMKNYFEQLGVDITKEEYYTLFKDIGQIIDGKIDITNATRK